MIFCWMDRSQSVLPIYVDGFVGYFHSGTIMSNAAVNIYIQALCGLSILSGMGC